MNNNKQTFTLQKLCKSIMKRYEESRISTFVTCSDQRTKILDSMKLKYEHHYYSVLK